MLLNAYSVRKVSLKRQLANIRKDLRFAIRQGATSMTIFVPLNLIYPEVLKLLLKNGFDITELKSEEEEYISTKISWENGKTENGLCMSLDIDRIYDNYFKGDSTSD